MGETWASLDGDKDSSRAMSIKDSRCSKGSTKRYFLRVPTVCGYHAINPGEIEYPYAGLDYV